MPGQPATSKEIRAKLATAAASRGLSELDLAHAAGLFGADVHALICGTLAGPRARKKLTDYLGYSIWASAEDTAPARQSSPRR